MRPPRPREEHQRQQTGAQFQPESSIDSQRTSFHGFTPSVATDDPGVADAVLFQAGENGLKTTICSMLPRFVQNKMPFVESSYSLVPFFGSIT